MGERAVSPVFDIEQRIAQEGKVFRVGPEGPLGLFDPGLVAEVNETNHRGNTMPRRWGDIWSGKAESSPIEWSRVRAAMASGSRTLSGSAALSKLNDDMRGALTMSSGKLVDLTWTAARAITKPLIAMTIGGLTSRDAALIDRVQVRAMRDLFSETRNVSVASLAERRVSETLAGFAVKGALKARAQSGEQHDDLTQALMPLLPELGLTSAAYTVMTMLTAVAGAPGPIGACLLFELMARPEWKKQIEAELGSLSAQELFVSAARVAPITNRFILEVMRVCSFPMLTRRTVWRTLQVGGHTLAPGDSYLLSAYISHNDDAYWRDPTKFDPDRWLAPEADRSKCAYVPFGWTPRTCPGASLGMAQLFLFCRLITTEFKVDASNVPDGYMDRSTGLALPRLFRGTWTPIGS